MKMHPPMIFFHFTVDDRSILMRPAQVKNLTNGEIGHCEGDGPPGSECLCGYHVTLSWVSQDYSGVDYVNPPSGIHVSEADYEGGPWTVIQDLAADATSTGVCFTDCYPVFKVSTYNSSGDAYGAPLDTITTDCYGEKIADGHPVAPTSFDVTVHPNPSNSSAKICVTDLPGGLPAVVEVVDQTGQVVSTLYNATPEAELGLCLTLNCASLPSGIYYAHVSNGIMGQSVKLSVEH